MSSPSFTPEIEVKVLDKRLNDWGLPTYQSEMAAAIDLHACIDAPMQIEPQAKAVLIPSGLALYMNNPHVAAVILPRSGLGHKHGLVLGNGTGLIDPDYTAQIFVSVWNRNPAGNDPIVIQPGERIAQMMFLPVIRPNLSVVEEFSGETARGGGGFGSTGSK
ncbi:dUTP diphosphatase [Donghicola sp. C2-DW-16]|uniref:dUTP diphosphatase n=1 Tax=Donghicola mangrovi TaxID=2729614 RepID=A0ABX2PAX8_9RHOB|nr:dUTP diphosphatase [Donghicola mangrovi]NVO26635.1 dUTP diphosphatase [Donghicola mangrovi]